MLKTLEQKIDEIQDNINFFWFLVIIVIVFSWFISSAQKNYFDRKFAAIEKKILETANPTDKSHAAERDSPSCK